MSFPDYLETLEIKERTMLLPALLETQRKLGYISKENAAVIGKALKVPLAEVSGVIEFYSMLSSKPTGETTIRVCTSPVCSLKGSKGILKDVIDELGIEAGKSSADGKYFVEGVECLGLCEYAPAALHNDRVIGQVTAEKAISPKSETLDKRIFGENRVLTDRCGKINPASLDDFKVYGGFSGFDKALTMKPDEVVNQIKDSGLKGRGGAAFPTGVKWEGAAEAKGEPKYVVCNADESEPGTFKDRILLEGDPFSILEGMTICGYAIGASKGYIYIRGEYQNAQRIFNEIIKLGHEQGYLGKNIMGSGFDFEVEVRSGAGAYICGEETALFESIEGKRGFPRIKPPFPTTHGLFNKPTVINNVETFANIPLILRKGAEEYRTYGTPDSSGPRLFCLSGDVARPGTYEITRSVTLREMIFDHAGGILNGNDLKAVLLGGAAGKLVPPSMIDVPLTFEDTLAVGLSLGSGVISVFDETRDLHQILSDLGHFFAHESCGKCFPCQLGTQRQAEILDRFLVGRSLAGDLDRLLDVGWTMTDASLCGLGQTAASAVLSAVEHWPELFN